MGLISSGKWPCKSSISIPSSWENLRKINNPNFAMAHHLGGGSMDSKKFLVQNSRSETPVSFFAINRQTVLSFWYWYTLKNEMPSSAGMIMLTGTEILRQELFISGKQWIRANNMGETLVQAQKSRWCHISCLLQDVVRLSDIRPVSPNNTSCPRPWIASLSWNIAFLVVEIWCSEQDWVDPWSSCPMNNCWP